MAGVLWAEPRAIESPADCLFYHTIYLPGHGLQKGFWDLRGCEKDYLGHVELSGKSVLEIGPANGFLSIYMKRAGAEVASYDLSPDHAWDVVPYHGADTAGQIAHRKHLIGKINDGYWLAHRLYGMEGRVAYGHVYDLPEDIGEYDIGTFGSVLLHLRDPFRALERVARHVKQTMVVTEIVSYLNQPGDPVDEPRPSFLPNGATGQPFDTWWELPPRAIVEMLGVLGFPRTDIRYHSAWNSEQGGRQVRLYTVVASRS